MSDHPPQRDPQADLDRIEAELNLLARSVSHDLRQPLHVISGYVELVAFKYRNNLDPKGHQLVSKALSGVERMNTMIDALVGLMRIDAHAPWEDRVDTNALVDAALQGLDKEARQAGATLERGDLPAVPGHPALLAQVFEQLLANVLRFPSDDPPHGRVTAIRQPGSVCFAVTDKGPGLDARLHKGIFLPFGRGQDRRAGTGMGLAICSKVMDIHGGCMGLESTVGKGSTFWFELPTEP